MGRSRFSLSRLARPWNAKDSVPNDTKSSASDTTNFLSRTEEEKSNKKTGELKDAAKRFEEELARATIPIEDRIAGGDNRMWDLEFSSMSSYASHDLKISALESPGSECCDNATSSGGVDASGSEIEEEQEAGQCNIEHRQGGVQPLQTFAKFTRQRRRRNYSLSAELPVDLQGPAGDSIALVMESGNPYRDFRLSVEEMVRENGIYEWRELQELLYCYISLNSAEQQESIKQAFVDVILELHLEEDLDFFFE